MFKVFSTYTKDMLFNENDKLIKTQKGGPAFFMEKVFKKNKVKHTIFSQKAEINIKVAKGKEEGLLKNKLKTKKIKVNTKDEVVIISTVDNEWMPGEKFSRETKVFLDAQGYVRSARKDKSIYKNKFWKEIFCLKINDKEINNIPRAIITEQKKRCLIVTQGSRGSVVYFKNKKYNFPVKKVVAKDAIGAGDTFFASFVISFYKTKGDIVKSGQVASRDVESFLTLKNN